MMSKLVLIVLIIGTVTAATWKVPQPIKPEGFDEDGCYIKEINATVPFGTTVLPLGYCYRINCGEKFLNYASCGTVSTDDANCYVTKINLSKPYPECCPKIKCDNVHNKV